MPEKILQTRIQLKYDTLENWTTNNPVLKAGEVAIVAIPTDSESTVGQVTKPAIVFKVGDGTSTFTALPYASGLAADVYAWAKAATKPAYTYSEVGAAAASHTHTTSQITDFTTAVEGIVDAAIAEIPEAAEYTLKSDSEGTVSLYKNNTIVGTAVPITGFSDIADLARSAVQSITTGSANGTISVDGSDVAVKGLGSAAYTESSAYATTAQGAKADTAVQTVVEGATNGTIAVDGEDVPVHGLGSAAYTESSAYDAAGAATNTVSTHNTSGTAHSDIRALITALQGQVGDLGNALHFVGAGPVADRPQSGAAGDVYVATDEGKEYVYTGTAWEEFGSGDHITKAQADGWYDAKGTAAGLIANLDKEDSAVANQYVTAVSEQDGVITVERKQIVASEISGLGSLATKSAVAIGEVTGLQDELDTKLEDADIADLATKDEVTEGLAGKQDTIVGAQLNALNSGITAAKVGTYDGYATNIAALEAKPGLDKVGTVTNVSAVANSGLKVTNGTTTPVIDFDSNVVFVFDCGSSSVNVD